jgi:hypothetical protein
MSLTRMFEYGLSKHHIASSKMLLTDSVVFAEIQGRVVLPLLLKIPGSQLSICLRIGVR